MEDPIDSDEESNPLGGEHGYIPSPTGVHSLSSQVRHYTGGSPPPTKLEISVKTPPPVEGLLACQARWKLEKGAQTEDFLSKVPIGRSRPRSTDPL